jgi:hypothetical protein
MEHVRSVALHPQSAVRSILDELRSDRLAIVRLSQEPSDEDNPISANRLQRAVFSLTRNVSWH